MISYSRKFQGQFVCVLVILILHVLFAHTAMADEICKDLTGNVVDVTAGSICATATNTFGDVAPLCMKGDTCTATGDGQINISDAVIILRLALGLVDPAKVLWPTTLPNQKPTISTITAQTTNTNTATRAISFTVGDAETATNSLTVTASSSNKTLVPDASIVLGGSGANRTITATPASGQSGNSTITVTVNDGKDAASTTFLVSVVAPNSVPVAKAGADQSVASEATVTLDGSGSSDADPGTTLNYSWLQTSGTLVTLSSASVAKPTFTAPSTIGALVFSLTVNDGKAISSASTTVTVAAKITDGLVAYYPFNGNANDESGNHLNGTITGTILTNDRFGKAGSAYFFDGTGSYIKIPNNNVFNYVDGLTISSWIKPNNINGPRVIVSKWDDNAKKWSYIFKKHNGPDKIRIELSKSYHNDLGDLASLSSVPLGTWMHTVITFDSKNLRIFINGLQDSVLATTGNIINSDTEILIGAANNKTEFFNGVIDDVRIYNRALTGSDIKFLYDAEKP